MRKVVISRGVTPLVSAMSHAVRANGMIYVSGATPYKGAKEIAVDDFEAQCHQVMRNIQTVLEENGTSFAQAVRLNVALKRMSDFAVYDEVFRSYFEAGNYPARMTTESPHLAAPEFLLSIDCIAVCPDE